MSSDPLRPTTRALGSTLLLGSWIAICALTVACGNKEAPQPPPRMIAAPTKDLTVQQRGNEVILSFTYPTVTVTGFTLGELQAVELWDLEQELKPELAVEEEAPDPLADETRPAQRQAEQRPEQRLQIDPFTYETVATLRATLRDDELTSAVAGEKIVTRLPMGEADPLSEIGHVYAIRTISSRGLASNYSNFAPLVRRQTPPAPAPFEVIPGPDSIELRWGEQPEAVELEGEGEEPAAEQPPQITIGEAPAPPTAAAEEKEERDDGIVGYRVYRRDAHARDYGDPLRELVADATSFYDTTAMLGNSYIYAVTAVIETRPLVETALSVEHEVDYEDRFAPPAPGNLIALVERNSVRILWDESRADDVRGYFVLRAEGDGEFVQLNDEPIEVLEYVDTDVRPRGRYRYVVEGIDQSGNRGEPGREIQAQVP